MNFRISSIFSAVVVALISFSGQLAPAEETALADQQVADYFKAQTAEISSNCMSSIHSLADWEAKRPEFQREAQEMLGLDPMPPRTALHPVITGRIEEKDFTVEKLYFESLPHFYVTADLYLPKGSTGPRPTVLYLCGHTEVISNGISYGNKVAYQHHGIWFARNGYVCLIVDTLQYGEILGHHHGTYDEGAWWWNSRGYTPAAVETWNAIRALDYLDSRPEVDTNRIGVTGRSGGGAYSWFLAAVDDRVKVVAPVAGIGDLESYCVDGTVDDHCDCMFFVNTYRWDYPLLAALCAPRPLLLADTDADEYFPLHGVVHTRDMVKRIYDLYGASTNFGLVIAPGPHKDTQDVQVPVFRWFDIHLKHEDPTIELAAVKMFSPRELKVFEKIPDDQINTRIEYSFEPMARTPKVSATAEEWERMKSEWMTGLREKCFAGWPKLSPQSIRLRLASARQAVHSPQFGIEGLQVTRYNGIEFDTYRIQSQPDVSLPLYIIQKAGAKPRRLMMRIADDSFTNVVWGSDAALNLESAMGVFADDEFWQDIKTYDTAFAIFSPRGIGRAEWSGGPSRETQLRRRFMLIGQTLDGMRVWDICRAVEAIHSMKTVRDVPLTVVASGNMGVNALYASLFASGISRLHLTHIPASQMEGPDYLNVLKILDIPEAAAMAAERCPLWLQSDETNGWEFLRAMEGSPVGNVKVEWDK